MCFFEVALLLERGRIRTRIDFDRLTAGTALRLEVPLLTNDERIRRSGLARDVDLLVHDAQYSLAEYPNHVDRGHSALDHALAFAGLTRAKHLVTFHHDPAHDDDDIDRLTAEATATVRVSCALTAGAVFELG